MKQVEITSKVVGRGESEGITSAIPSINLSGFALKSDLLTLEKKFSDFLNVPIIDGTINRWNELETFLAGISEDYNLLSLLNGKADKSYVDTNFVTIAGTEDVTGLHNFVNGLKIGGLPITKKQDDVVYLDANLVVRGGITMYGDGEGGSSVPLYSTLGSLLNVDESNDAVASVDRVLFQSAGSNVWSWKALSEIGGGGSVSGNYLPLSGGTMNDETSIKFQGNNSYGSSRWEIFAYGPSFQIKYGTYGSTTTPNGALEIGNDGKMYNDGKLVLTESNYSSYALPLSGGTLTKESYPLKINVTNANYSAMTFLKNGVEMGSLGFYSDGVCYIKEGTNTELNHVIHSGNISSYNAGSATKLQTARTIWGQSFDGTGNIEGVLYNVGAILGGINGLNISTHPLYVHLDVGVTFVNKTNQQYLGEIAYYKDHFIVGNYKNERENSAISLYDNGDIVFDGNGRFMLNRSVIYINDANKSNATPLSYWGLYSWNNTFSITTRKDSSGDYLKGIVDFDVNGNVLAYGGITMYSDQRKKTILNHVELSLKQIADAPLIEHYYNSDQEKTTHVGSIAQYWAGINDWFCKLDNEGFYTMEIQNCALASAISIARHLEKYETKTDKTIRKMKQRIQELEDEVERLKQN